MAEAKITQVNPTSFELEDYSVADENLISSLEIDTTFNQSTDYIEYFIYNPNNGGLIFPPNNSPSNYTNFILEDNILAINPEEDLRVNGFEEGTYNTFYNFLSTRLSSNFSQRYYISEISSDRTEIRLTSNDISTEEIVTSTTEFIQERNTDEYYPDFYLNFGNNQLVIANNILLDVDTILIKLYEPLPPQYQSKSTLWVVEQVADPIAYLVELPFEPIVIDNTIKLKGPNINLSVKGQVNNSTEETDFTSLTETSLTSSLQQVNSFYADPSVQINVDYTNFSNFIKFSSAEKRLNNFFYKLQQIENWTTLANTGSASTTTASSASTAFYQTKINETIEEFDNYEYYLYYTSGSKSWPKSNTEEPYEQQLTTSSGSQTWLTASLATASLYDENNQDWIYYAIPEYIREDSSNQPYLDFSNMVGHFYDENIWVYIKDITNKWDNDNRIDSGISRDLIAQQLRDLGFNLYENQFSSFNLFTATLGLTPSGSYFPFPNMTGSLPTPSGFEYIDNSITGSNEILPQDDIKKRIYKRLYHNLPYLYKKKGTVDGIRTLATIYGIPNTLLRIDEFGGKDKTNVNDWDYWFEQFNYAYSTGDDGKVSTNWNVNTSWNSPDNVPSSLQFRFKLPPSSSIPTSQSLWTLGNGRDVRLVLEYDTTLLDSGSFSGSIPNPNNQYADLKFYPNHATDATEFASVSLPFANSDWWSVMVNREGADFELVAANKIYSGSNGSSLGFIASSSVNGDDSTWPTSTNSYFPTVGGIGGYTDFSGSYQEIRYYNTQISHNVFKDYVMNPQSIEGNTINSTPDELIFRASLGGELYTGSTSIHPKITGSWSTLNSFVTSSIFTIDGGNFAVNREYVFMDQPAVGIKNRITDKIRQVDLNLPSGSQQLSNIRSIQQDTEIDDAYTNTINQVEVVLSPTNQINDDIISSIGYFNIGDYIGDPRQITSGSTSYSDLDTLRDEYFLKYTGNYDWNDFIRLVKFFDNSLWKTVKDFIPSKVSSATGISIKQHLLERQKYPEPSASYSEPYYTGSISQTAGLLSGSRIYSASTAEQSFPIETITGSQGGTLPQFVPNTNYTVNNIVNVTQSWNGSNITPFGFEDFTRDDAREFVNGEFSGSTLVVTTQSLNPNNPYKFANTTQILYDITSSATTVPFGYDITDPDVGQLNFEILRQVGPKGGFYNCTQIWINETDKNNLDISTPLDNLSAGDTFTFTGQFQIENNGLPPTTLTYTRTFTGIISSVATVNSDVYNIQFDPPAPSGVGDGDGSFINVNSRILANQSPQLNPYVDTPNLRYSDFNALINNDLTARRSNIFWDVDYNSNAIQAVNQQVLITASQQGGELPKAFVQDYNYHSTPITTRNYKGSKNTVASFNTGSGYNSQYSVGTYVAYYSRLIASGGGPYTGTMIIEYIIAPDGTLIEAINNEDNLELLKQNFVNNQFSEGQVQMIATPFSSSDTIQVDFTERLEAKSRAKLQLEGKRTGNAYVNDSIGGIVYPAGIELSSAKNLPQTARQILSDNRII